VCCPLQAGTHAYAADVFFGNIWHIMTLFLHKIYKYHHTLCDVMDVGLEEKIDLRTAVHELQPYVGKELYLRKDSEQDRAAHYLFKRIDFVEKHIDHPHVVYSAFYHNTRGKQFPTRLESALQDYLHNKIDRRQVKDTVAALKEEYLVVILTALDNAKKTRASTQEPKPRQQNSHMPDAAHLWIAAA
jgi:hypothetical protein